MVNLALRRVDQLVGVSKPLKFSPHAERLSKQGPVRDLRLGVGNPGQSRKEAGWRKKSLRAFVRTAFF